MRPPSELRPDALRLAALLAAALGGLLVWLAIEGREPRTLPASGDAQETAQAPPESPPTAPEAIAAYAAERQASLGTCVDDAGLPVAPPRTERPLGVSRFIGVLSKQLERLRRLEFRRAVDAEFLDGPAIERRIAELVEAERRPGLERAETRLLTALGVLPEGSDVFAIRRRALKGQVAGLYAPETEELLVRTSEEFGLDETITLVHELEHALADQALGLERDTGGPARADAALAYAAVVEGDATFSMTAYLLRHGGTDDFLDVGSSVGPAGAQRRFDALPYLLQRELLFPYLEGLAYVCERFGSGGWDAVDREYRSPPRTSAEVMFADRAAREVDPAPLGDLRGAWKRQLDGALGAAHLEWLFAAPGDDLAAALPDPRRAASAWSGGRFELWRRGRESAVGITLADRGDRGELCRSLISFYVAAFPQDDHATAAGEGSPPRLDSSGPRQDAAIRCAGHDVRLGIAPEARLAARLARGSP